MVSALGSRFGLDSIRSTSRTWFAGLFCAQEAQLLSSVPLKTGRAYGVMIIVTRSADKNAAAKKVGSGKNAAAKNTGKKTAAKTTAKQAATKKAVARSTAKKATAKSINSDIQKAIVVKPRPRLSTKKKR